MNLPSGVEILYDGTDITGPGLANITGATVNVGDAAIDSVNAENLALSSGILQGPGTLTVTDTMNWTASTMQGGGVTQIASGATLNIGVGGDKWRFVVSRDDGQT